MSVAGVEAGRAALPERLRLGRAALDLTGAPTILRAELEKSAAGTVKRVLRTPQAEPDWTKQPDITRLRAYLEAKTVWHPMGV